MRLIYDGLILILAALCAAASARADIVLSGDLGKNIILTGHSPFERYLSLSYQKTLAPDLYIEPALGGWLSDGIGRSSGFTAARVGVRANSSLGLELHFSIGPALITSPDQLLSTHFEWAPEFGGGLRGSSYYLGLVFDHYSNAGFHLPNIGRDFVGAQLRILFI